MSDDPTLAELIRRAIRAEVVEIHTSMPGEIVSYDRAKKTATVKPLLYQKVPTDTDDLEADPLPLLQNVKVKFPESASFAFSFGLAEGDAVTIFFQELSDADWRKSGNAGAPRDTKHHPLYSCFVMPGRFTDANTPSDETDHIGKRDGTRVFFQDSCALVSEKTKLIEGDSITAQFVALSEVVDSNFQQIADLFANWTPIANDGGAALKTAATNEETGLDFESTAAANLKAEPPVVLP